MALCVVYSVMLVGDVQFRPTTTYEAVLADSSGLRAGEEVRIAGVRVGQVDGLSPLNIDQVLVQFSIGREYPLTRATHAAVRLKNLTGDHYLQLTDGLGDPRPLPPGGRIPVSQTQPALDLDALLAGFQPLLGALDPAQVNQLTASLVAVLQGQSGTLAQLLGVTSTLTGTLADHDQLIQQVITNLNQTLGTVDGRSAELSTLLTNLQSLVSGLAGDRQTIGGSLDGINHLADATSGLLDQARPPLAGDIQELGRLSRLLNQNSATLNTVLADSPEAYQRLTAIGRYGSFFNFYLCDIRVALTGPDGQTVTSPTFASSEKRCAPR
jgi:phospholipid/cholesterol/gamma-HCH transport system substrate-binding protein